MTARAEDSATRLGLHEAPENPEPELEEAFDRLVDEGVVRLSRPWLALIATALLGGVDVGTGVLASAMRSPALR